MSLKDSDIGYQNNGVRGVLIRLRLNDPFGDTQPLNEYYNECNRNSKYGDLVVLFQDSTGSLVQTRKISIIGKINKLGKIVNTFIDCIVILVKNNL